jgi:hypothetical protein
LKKQWYIQVIFLKLLNKFQVNINFTAKLAEKYIPYCSIAVYLILFASTYKWYEFHFDVDGVGYMAIAKHVANNEWYNSINGIWSPLNCWIAGFMMKALANPIFVFKLINAISSVGIILLMNRICSGLFSNTSFYRHLVKAGIMLSLPVILLSYTHHQLAGDLIQLNFILLYFILLISKDFFLSVRKNILAGFVMSLAYLGKAYNLPFFIIAHFAVYLFFYWQNQNNYNITFLLKRMLSAYFIFFVLITPWVITLSLKYNQFTFSTVSTFNFNWLLSKNGENVLQTPGILLAPPYPSSVTMWEDPYLYYKSFKGPLDSSENFLLFLKIILHNIKVFIKCMSDISFLSTTVLSIIFIQVLLKREKTALVIIALVLIFFSVFGYLLIYIETRYIWFAGLLSMVLGGKLLADNLYLFKSRKLKFFLYTVFFGSYLLWPADRLQDMKNSSIDLPFYKKLFQEKNIKGNFTAYCRDADDQAICLEVAFFTDNRYYVNSGKNEDPNLLKEIQDQQIGFYFYFYNSPLEKEAFLNSAISKKAAEKLDIAEKELIILKL